MRASTNISVKERRVFTLDKFGGVDLTSAPEKVAPQRASKMVNFIKDGEQLRKRPGFKEIFKLDDLDVVSGIGFINGIFTYYEKGYSAEDEKDTERPGGEILIIVSGGKFYRIKENPDNPMDYKVTYLNGKAQNPTHRLPDDIDGADGEYYAEGFYDNAGRLFIIGRNERRENTGVYAVYGTWGNDSDGHPVYELRDVSSVAYVPTTTISIDNDDVGTDNNKSLLDEVNRLTIRRKNSLLGVENPLSDEKYWTLDGEILNSVDGGTRLFSYVKLEVQRAVTEGESGEVTSIATDVYSNVPIYAMQEGNRYKTPPQTACEFSKNIYLIPLGFEDKPYFLKEQDVSGAMHLFKWTGTVWEDTGELPAGNVEEKVYSYDVFDRILLTVDTKPVVEDQDNIKVEFSVAKPEEETGADIPHNAMTELQSCNFGCIFGIASNRQRLFLSGGYKINKEFYSEENDFTYFPDLNYFYIGSDASAIVGYQQLSDNTLAVFKERKLGDSAIHYQTTQDTEVYDDYGDIVGYETVFPVTPGNMDVEMVSRAASRNFQGDNLILTGDGVYAVVMAQNISIVDRNVRERSRLINRELRKNEKCSAISFDNKYFLWDGKMIYVADAREKTVVQGDIDGSFNYEWFPCELNRYGADGETPHGYCAFCIYRGKLIFSNRNASICAFQDGLTADYAQVATMKASSHYFDYDTAMGVFALANSDTIGEEVYNAVVDDTYIEMRPVGSGYIANVTVDDETGGKTFIVRKNKYSSVQVKPTGEDVPTHIQICYKPKPVSAEWQSAIMNLGTDLYSKTLTHLSISCESEAYSDVKFGYQTKHSKTAFFQSVRGDGRYGDTNGGEEKFNMADFTFNEGFMSSYSFRVNERNFNYILFRIKSEGNDPCSINGITAMYKVNKLNKGVM